MTSSRLTATSFGHSRAKQIVECLRAYALAGFLATLAFSAIPVVIGAAGALGVALVRRQSTGLLIAIISVGVLIQMPWIIVALAAGLSWSIASRSGRQLTPTAPIRFRALAIIVVAGVLAGAVAAALALPWLEANPVVLPFPTPAPVIALAAVAALAAANAVGEELIWRGALSLQFHNAPTGWQYVLQSATFGLAHFHGIPAGTPGVLASSAFGLVAFYVHRRWGLSAAILLHFAADLVIFSTALALVRNEFVVIG